MNPIVQWVLRTMMKGQTGVVKTLPKKELLDMNVNMTIERLLRNNIDPSTIKTPDQLDNIIKQIEAPRNVQTGIKNTKSAKIFDMEGKEIPKDAKIMGGKQAETEAEIAARMNKENKEAAQRFKEKQKEAMDDMKDIEDPEDMADGGVAGMLGERPGYQDGSSVLDNVLAVASVPYNFAKGIIGNPSNPGAVTDVSLTSGQKNFLDNIAKSKNKKSGTIDYSDYGSPTKTFSGISEMSPMQASLATTMGGTGFNIKPDGSVDYTGGAYDFNMGNAVTDFIDEGGIYGLIDRLQGNPQEEDDFDIKSIVANLLSKQQIEQAKTFKKMKEAELAKETPTDGGSGADGGSGTKKGFSAPTKQGQSPRGSTTGGNGGGGSASPGSEGPGGSDAMGSFKKGGIAGERQNFAMGKRAFLKMLAGAGAGIAGLKTGALSMFGKGAGKQVATEVAKDVATTSGAPPYFFNLVKKIKNLGDEVPASKDKAVAKQYKDYVMEEDFQGNIEIKKTNYGMFGDEIAPTEEVYMTYQPGKGMADETTKGKKVVDEYEEFTAKPDIDGKMKDVEGGVPDEVIEEGTMFEDNITDFGKADGGIARMLGE